MDRGFRVGMIAQPDVGSGEDITRLGRPELFWSVSAGCVDSMVANYTPTRKFRKDDDFTPGGVNDRRPDRACIAYTNLIKRYAKGAPVVLAGIEASLRRVAHYDFWSDSVRRSVLFDSKADAIVYGMGELTNLELAQRMRDGVDWRGIRGICVASKEAPDDYLRMPSYEEVSRRDDRRGFMEAFSILRRNSDPVTARGLFQPHGDRVLVQNPPRRCLTAEELDAAYGSDFENAVHPYYARMGHVRAMDTVRNSVTTHRGCYGDCSFCAISAHQGTTVVSRSEGSILDEVRRMAASPGFDGVIRDVGGPTANMYGIECAKKPAVGRCEDRRCLGGRPCPRLPIDHSRQIRLLEGISSVEGVRRVYVASGIRHDMVVADGPHGREYLGRIVGEHTSGQLKVAPEHVCDDVLRLMGKPGRDSLVEFKGMFDREREEAGLDEYLTYYLMAGHPGCTESHMEELSRFCSEVLRTRPEQVQVFTPTPSTYSTAMWWCGCDERGRPVRVERSIQGRQRQKEAVTGRRGHGRRPVGTAERALLPLRGPGRGGLRVEEGLLPQLAQVAWPRDRHPVRLPEGVPRGGRGRLRRDGGPQGVRAPLGGPGVVPDPREVRLVRQHQEARVRAEEQEPHPQRGRGERGPHGLAGEAAGHGSHRPGGHRELLVLVDAQRHARQDGLLLHHVPRRRDLGHAGQRGRGRQAARLRGVSRVPPPEAGLPPRREGPRQGVPRLGAPVPGLGGLREGPQGPVCSARSPKRSLPRRA